MFIKVKIDNLKELSNSIPLKLNKEVKKNNEIIKIIIVKKYLLTSFKSKVTLLKKYVYSYINIFGPTI